MSENTYKAAGVDIEAGDETVRRIKKHVKQTFNKSVLSDIGLFGGFFEPDFSGYEKPVLVASTDGVGTKLKIAFLTGKHDTVGQCLVNHCVNDILCCGAKPLFFLDYFAVGKLEPDIAEQVIKGFSIACRENGCALIGGETAEMPSFYQPGEYDISGTIVGIVDKSKIVDGKNINAGDVLIGLPSNGLHTNGYSLARAVLLKNYKVDKYFDEMGKTLGEVLLDVHKSYLNIVYPALEKNLIKGISHITGGGIIGNTSRIIPKGLELKIDWGSWALPPIFRMIQSEGKISDDEMRHVFNLGIGMILVSSKENAEKLLESLKNHNPILIGNISN
ncbi:MAG: phosphoribosylformylglycinamidine cyclo-ligase [Bacteroidota bacterium]|nr:phosphoribosylformylglycinamidine cyclo-ligase [Bacteroidota bacterium]